MIKRFLLGRIYKIKTTNRLEKISAKNNFCYINCVLHYLLIIEDYEKMNKIIESKIKNAKNKKHKEILNYYWCIYFINKNEKYNADKLYARLNKKNQIKIDLLRCKNTSQQLKIFDDKFVTNLNSIKTNKNYGNLIDILYLLNLLRKDKIVSRILEIRINLKINLILLKWSLGINDIEFISTIIDIMNLYYSLNVDKEKNFPISVNLLKRMVYKLSKNVILYEEILDKSIIKYNEKVCLGFRSLLSIDNCESNQRVYLNDLNKFIQKNKVEEYTRFIFEISNNRNSSEKENIDVYIDEIRKIVNEEINGDIMHIIYMCASFIKEGKLLDFYNKFKKIKYNGKNDIIKESLELGNNILNFWCGDKINLSFVTKNIFISKFLKLIISMDNDEITYEEFLEQLKDIDHIEVYSIFSWEKMDFIFNKYNYDWLRIILEKIDRNEIDYRFKNYLLNVYIKILNHKKHIFFNEFNTLNKLVLLKNNEISFQIYSVVTLLSVYNIYNEEVKKMIYTILNNEIKINVDNKILESFVLATIVFVSRNKDKIDIYLMKQFIEKRITGNKKILFLIGLYFIEDKQIDKKEYDNFLRVLYEIYVKNDVHDVVEFSVISHIANNILIEKKCLHTDCQDIVYYDMNKLFVLAGDYVEEYKSIYRKFGAKKVNSVSKDAKFDTLLSIIICKIYFSNIEKFDAGKMIKISSELKGKELMLELLKEMGYEETQEQISKIKQGELVNSLWLNEFNLHTFMKDIKSKVDNKFVNSFNKLNLIDKKIIHVTSLALLAKLGIIEKLEKSNNYYCTGYVLKEIKKMNDNGTLDMIDGVIEEAICYDDYIISINSLLNKLKEKKQIEYISSANILGIKEINRFNKFDEEFIKIASTYNSNNLFSIITEDPFYFKTDFFKNISYGTYSLIIDMLRNNIITGSEFLHITQNLEKMNYNLKISADAYRYILSLSADADIMKTIKILNKYN